MRVGTKELNNPKNKAGKLYLQDGFGSGLVRPYPLSAEPDTSATRATEDEDDTAERADEDDAGGARACALVAMGGRSWKDSHNERKQRHVASTTRASKPNVEERRMLIPATNCFAVIRLRRWSARLT